MRSLYDDALSGVGVGRGEHLRVRALAEPAFKLESIQFIGGNLHWRVTQGWQNFQDKIFCCLRIITFFRVSL